MTRECHNHRLQTKPWQREEEAHNQETLATTRMHSMQIIQFSLRPQDDCKTRKDTKNYGKFGHRSCLFHILFIGIKITEQTVKILMSGSYGAVSSGFPLFANVCPNLPDFRSYLTLPYMPTCWPRNWTND